MFDSIHAGLREYLARLCEANPTHAPLAELRARCDGASADQVRATLSKHVVPHMAALKAADITYFTAREEFAWLDLGSLDTSSELCRDGIALLQSACMMSAALDLLPADMLAAASTMISQLSSALTVPDGGGAPAIDPAALQRVMAETLGAAGVPVPTNRLDPASARRRIEDRRRRLV